MEIRGEASASVRGGAPPPVNNVSVDVVEPMDPIRYSAAACQTDMPNPIDRRGMRSNTDRMLSMVDSAVAGSAPFLPVRLVAFPEFAHAAPVFPTVQELLEKLTVPIPNEHTERLTAKAREHEVVLVKLCPQGCEELAELRKAIATGPPAGATATN